MVERIDRHGAMRANIDRPRRPALSAIAWGLGFAAVLIANSHAALAQPFDGSPRHTPERNAESAAAGMFLPETMAPRVDSQAAFAKVVGSYDSTRRGTLEGTAEVTLVGPLAARVGVLYAENPNALRPTGGLRLQALSQADQLIDMSVGAFYRPEGFTEAEGEVEAVLAFGRRFNRLGTFASLVYGQDPEGAERDGEVRLAALYALSARLQTGFDSRLRFDLGSEPSKRRAEGGARYDLIAGPAVTYSFETIALIAQVGLSAVGQRRTIFGAACLAGLGGSL
jgi:hypothetical protein